MDKPTILIVVGLKREAALLAGPGVRVVIGGGASGALEVALTFAAEAGAAGVLSIGLAGALDGDLKPGDWVVASGVVDASREAMSQVETDPRWAAALASGLPGARRGLIAGSDVMAVDDAAKRALAARTGALAVDMESHVAARVASRFGLPFAAARVISDGANRSLPRAAQLGMRADGSMDLAAVLKSLAADPRQLPALIRTGIEAEAAFSALRLGRRRLGPTLGFPYVERLQLA